jgi:demethylmenaquinone methyltransferase / 2-methoxy-6-polyprenyl-1,4-benzoquinol methylase
MGPVLVRERIRDFFDTIAPRYDGINTLSSMGIDYTWRRALIRRFPKVNSGLVVLDVATGTGEIAKLAAKQPQVGMVVGVDIAVNMLALAGPKLRKPGFCPSFMIEGDAECLPIQDQSVDVLTIAFGIRNVPNIDQALREFYRVLKPGGTFICLELTLPHISWVRHVYNLYFGQVVSRIGAALSRNREAYMHLIQSVRGFPSRNEFNEIVRKAGFLDCDYKNLTFGTAVLYTAIRGDDQKA